MNAARVVPLMPGENVLFPGMLLPLHVSRPEHVLLVSHCLDSSGEFGIILESDESFRSRRVGTVARILDYQTEEDGERTLLVTGGERFVIAEMIDDEPYLTAMIEPYPFAYDDSPQELASLATQARRMFNRCVRLISSQRGGETHGAPTLPQKASDLGWAIAASLAIPPEERQRLLEKGGPGHLLKSEVLYLESLLAELRHQADGEG